MTQQYIQFSPLDGLNHTNTWHNELNTSMKYVIHNVVVTLFVALLILWSQCSLNFYASATCIFFFGVSCYFFTFAWWFFSDWMYIQILLGICQTISPPLSLFRQYIPPFSLLLSAMRTKTPLLLFSPISKSLNIDNQR